MEQPICEVYPYHPHLTGTLIQGKEKRVVDSTYPSLVDVKIFDKIRQIFGKERSNSQMTLILQAPQIF